MCGVVWGKSSGGLAGGGGGEGGGACDLTAFAVAGASLLLQPLAMGVGAELQPLRVLFFLRGVVGSKE